MSFNKETASFSNKQDLENLVKATEVGLIVLDTEYCVQYFTARAAEIFELSDSDIGRPIKEIKNKLVYNNLSNDLKFSVDQQEKVKKVLSTTDKRWFIMQMCPYSLTDSDSEGTLLTLIEFTDLKDVQEAIREHKYQETLATLGVYALEQKDLQAILKRAIDLGCITLELDCSIIYAFNENESTFEIQAQVGCAENGDPVKIDNKLDICFAFDNVNEPTIVTDYTEEERFSVTPYLKNENIVSSVHIIVRGSEETYGLLGFYSFEKRHFSEEELHFLQVVAQIVGMAIEQQYARQKLKEEMERSRQFQKDILNNSLRERWELGGYLHDNLGQILATAKILTEDIWNKLSESEIDVSEEVNKINSMIDESIRGIRDLTHDIIPVDIEEEGVDHAFRFLMRQTQKMHEVNCTLETNGILNEIKNRKVATHLYYVVQEAVKNAALHGDAEHIGVKVSKSETDMIVRISDNGKGLLKKPEDHRGKGLRIMQYRMELLDGTIDVKENSSGKSGTFIICTVPLEQLKDGSN